MLTIHIVHPIVINFPSLPNNSLALIQMAPIHQDPKSQSSAGRERKITSYISVKTFFELFAGTVCIFFLGVLFWKIGQFLRFLSRHKVLRARRDKQASPRYAKTWYGWVKLSRHQANKQPFQKFASWVRERTMWKSSRADYSWIYWDPGQKKMLKHQEDKMALRWLPHFLRSYEVTPADVIWSPGPPGNRHYAEVDDLAVKTGTLPQCPHVSCRLSRLTVGSEPSLDGEYGSVHRGKLPMRERASFRGLTPIHRQHPSLFPGSEARIYIRRVISGPVSASCSAGDQAQLVKRQALSDSPFRVAESGAHRGDANALRFSRKYQVWSARMQLQTCGLTRQRQASQGPPGSPEGELLRSFASEDSSSVKTLRRLRGRLASTFSMERFDPTRVSLRHGYSRLQDADVEDERLSTRGYYPSAAMTFPLRKSKPRPFLDMDGLLEPVSSPNCQTPTSDQDRPAHLPNSSHQSKHLDLWEMRLIDHLDRKLRWFHSEITPGQKPFHFPTLANHWLNNQCWMVADPPSRTTLEAQRLWGDPRFNFPYPEPTHGPKPKYPTRPQRRTRVPRIDSWRRLVNRQRLQAGHLDIIGSVELFDGSTDEPGDGAIDPACWLLRRPPQGFGISNKQLKAFYGGGAGWQEKLDDWQKVGRGYRIRKAVHEGRANRTRAREVAIGIVRSCQTVSSKLPKSHSRGEE